LSGLVEKIKNFVGLNQELDYEEEFGWGDFKQEAEEFEEPEETHQESLFRTRKQNLKVVSHPNASAHELMVVEPKTFDDSLEIVNNLIARKSIVLNLHLLDAEQSQRVVDFIAGATHAVSGHQQRVGEGVFLFTPNNINIAVETDRTRILKETFWTQA
jgi:cell division inhibitor SepF